MTLFSLSRNLYCINIYIHTCTYILYIHRASEKNCAKLFLSQLCQISINCNIYKCTHTHTHTHTYIYIYIYTHIYINTHTHIYIYIYTERSIHSDVTDIYSYNETERDRQILSRTNCTVTEDHWGSGPPMTGFDMQRGQFQLVLDIIIN